MTKSEFLAQENVPEFIKEIVASIPDDADVDIEGFKLGRPPKKEGCSCGRVHEDGVDISPYIEGIADPPGITGRLYRLQGAYFKI